MEVLSRIIVGFGSIDEYWRVDIRQRVNIDSMEVVDSVCRSSVPRDSEIWDIRLGKEVDSVCLWIDDRGADNSYGIRDIYKL